ncbi:MAG: GNAT family N-acetyltransferase [Clostridia bacterium]|nr:GNAT family N-acetyltransferase [Clostridia bacterium]
MRIAKLTAGNPHLARIEEINNEAFPDSERVSVPTMLAFVRDGNGEILGLYEGKSDSAENLPVGFGFAVTGAQVVYLFFFAIERDRRNHGVGSRALAAICEHFHGRQVILDFEELLPGRPETELRERRKAFYLRNGFCETGRYTALPCGRFEVVCQPGQLLSDDFASLIHIIHAYVPDYVDALI